MNEKYVAVLEIVYGNFGKTSMKLSGKFNTTKVSKFFRLWELPEDFYETFKKI